MYKYPSKSLLIKSNKIKEKNYDNEKKNIEVFFRNYKIDIDCKDVYNGVNSITYVIDLKLKTKISTIKGYKEDLMLNFNAIDVEFQVAVNGTSYLGIQVIKEKDSNLILGDLIESKEFGETIQKIPIIMGQDLNGNTIVEDLTELPHLLIAGTTGTGKSNFLSTLIVDIIYKFSSEEIKLILVDTRETNFPRFNRIPHLLVPVIVDSKRAIGLLAFLVLETDKRYVLFEKNHVDNIDDYNKISNTKLPRFIVLIEDFYDLMVDTQKEIAIDMERIVQKSRAAGIHVILSTQRPSIDVIGGVIKANMPARLAFRVPSQFDSKTIIDMAGAEKLLMHGDAIFSRIGTKNRRIQTPYISDEEIDKIIEDIDCECYYDGKAIETIENIENLYNLNYDIEYIEEETDPLLLEAIETVIETGQVSTSFIQRRFKVGYARAGRIMDQMEERGIITGYQGSKPREVLMTLERWRKLKEERKD